MIACEKILPGGEAIAGTGTIITENRPAGSFIALENRIGANIYILKSDHNAIAITANQNLVPYIKTSVVNSTLIISSPGYYLMNDHEITIDVSMPVLEEIRLKGAGQVISGLPVHRIYLSGYGNISCNGLTDRVHVKLSGTGNIDLSSMPASNAKVELSGSGKVILEAKNQLDVSISGVGTVYYKGSARLTKKISGIGSVVKMD